MNLDDLRSRALLLDIETSRSGHIRQVGAVFDGRVLALREKAGSAQNLARLDTLGANADFVLGHNLLGHDFPLLQAAAPRLAILQKPVIDTLYLSPLAFPLNPYHHLVKDYKLVRAVVNDPLADARLAAGVFKDQWAQFAAMAAWDPGFTAFYRFCFTGSSFSGFSGAGLAAVFDAFVPEDCHGPDLSSGDAAFTYFESQTTDGVCAPALLRVVMPLIDDPQRRPALAYGLAWLRVAGGNSILPPWVRHRFPDVCALLKQLRERPCQDERCGYCRQAHDPEGQLKRFFAFPGFRAKPTTADGQSLQRAVVVEGMHDQPLMAIMPTGGGKSLCYQLPALVRHDRRGVLTVVVSPLLALMKDQVDNLAKNTGTPFAEAVYGLQTPPERGEVLERVRLGDVAIVYISPEQLRSRSVRNVLRQREIGCWVFDEAHCVSKWGHDFRPDYLYAARFIREFSRDQGHAPAPVTCYTATAKLDVIEEIITHFRKELQQDLKLFSGGVERENLTFEVVEVSAAERLERAVDILGAHQPEQEASSAVVYAATRRQTEEIRDYLRHRGLEAQAFHGGMDAKEKREIIEDFVQGRTAIICATNAFGMGIDKSNIRIVLHFQMPGSLENYIQEAGRAGRDTRPARCILFYDPLDAQHQFRMGAMTEIKQRDIQRILRAVRRVKPSTGGEIVITSDELLRDEELADLSRERRETGETKVRTAVAWLERAGFLRRNQNLTEVFQGTPLVESIAQAETKIAGLNLAPATQRVWLNILRVLFNNPQDQGLSADIIAEALFADRAHLQQLQAASGLTPAQLVLSALHDMADVRLLDRGVMLSAGLRPKGQNNAMGVLQAVSDLEQRLIGLMEAEDPDADNGSWVELNVRRLCQRLKNDGFEATPHVIRTLLKGLSYDGKGMAASYGSLEIRHVSRDRYGVRLQRSWRAVAKTAALRRDVAVVVLRTLVDKALKLLKKAGRASTSDVNLTFSSNELADAIGADITLAVTVKKTLPAIDRALMFLHENKAITLQGGLAILRQAMTIRLEPGTKGRRYTLGDFKPLAVHYRERRFQVHVMAEYAQLALGRIATALQLVLDYFAMGRVKFINRYFADRKALIAKAATLESYRKIVDWLGNPVQIAAVGSPVAHNMLILAGPGAGKTMVIVHRCAYLLQVERVPARQILILCFNHNAAVTLRKRLSTLVGGDARGVMVATYHGAAMHIAGISVRDVDHLGKGGEIDFDAILHSALGLLKGETQPVGVEPDQLRDQLLGGYSHILVDEYQDIDQDQYDLVSAIAGRTLEAGEGRLSILAVGDDDQNIYTFRGANVKYIRQFQKDYPAKRVYLVENYRSSKHIIAAANQLIGTNRDRVKGAHPIRINQEREASPPGGEWQERDPVSRGRVQVLVVKDRFHQAINVQAELVRLKGLHPLLKWADCAVLGRTREVLSPVRMALEKAGYPVKTVLERGFALHHIREVACFIDALHRLGAEHLRASQVMERLPELTAGEQPNLWRWMLADFLENYRDETTDAMLPADALVERLYDFVAEQRREKVLGRGIFLGTIHAAKGMEFSHVIVLDEDWSRPRRIDLKEEERRVFYVAMTRARETLLLMKSLKRPNPFLRELRGDHVMLRSASPWLGPYDPDLFQRTQLLGLNDIFMDFAAGFPARHPIHRHLAGLETGREVFLVPGDNRVGIQDAHGHRVGALSKGATGRWGGALKRVRSVRVVAVIQRGRKDPDPAFSGWIKTDRWELPLLEVRYLPEQQRLI